MRFRFAIFFLLALGCVNYLFSQTPTHPVYSLEQARNANKDSVFALQLHKQKLTELPIEIYQYKNLRYLDLSKNKLTSIPMEVNQFKFLEELNVGKNKLSVCPIVICSIPTLKVLKMNENPFSNLPECIAYLSDLEYLDLFETQVRSFPESLTKLEKLKKLDVRGILYGKNFQENWNIKLPQTTILFDLPCHCLED